MRISTPTHSRLRQRGSGRFTIHWSWHQRRLGNAGFCSARICNRGESSRGWGFAIRSFRAEESRPGLLLSLEIHERLPRTAYRKNPETLRAPDPDPASPATNNPEIDPARERELYIQ